jgi:hypothetical protein
MPIYATKCAVCGHAQDIYRPVAQYRDLPEHCGQTVQRVITAPYVAPDLQPFRSVVDGSVINSRSDRREHMRRHNLIEVGDAPIKQREYQGEHNVKPELTQAVKQVLRT